MEEQAGWRRCSACKEWIALDTSYYVCNVSTCNRKRTGLVFCSADCWEVHLPMMNHRLLLTPAVVFRFLEYDTTGENFFDLVHEEFLVTDISLHAHWYLSSAWNFTAGVSYALTDEPDRFLLDVGLTFRW